MPRAGSIEVLKLVGGEAFRWTELGLTELRQLARVGTPLPEAAAYFDVSESWLQKQMQLEGAIRANFTSGEADGKFELRKALHDAAVSGDARVLTFMGERRLGMNKVIENKTEHVIRVIGATPDAKADGATWFAKFAPKDITGALPPPDRETADASSDQPDCVSEEADGDAGPDGSDISGDGSDRESRGTDDNPKVGPVGTAKGRIKKPRSVGGG